MADVWVLGDRTARLQTELLHGAIDLARPDRGLTSLVFGGQQLDPTIELLAAELADAGEALPALADVYVRGNDVVATYGSSERRPIGVQVYWRAHADAESRIAIVDLEVSVQTQLLDSDPTMTTHSRLPAGEHDVVRRDPSCWLVRPKGASWSYAEMVCSRDGFARQVELMRSGTDCLLRHRLFADRLEKGVILRAQVRGVLVDRADDLAQAATAHRALVEAPPPLTT